MKLLGFQVLQMTDTILARGAGGMHMWEGSLKGGAVILEFSWSHSPLR